MIVIQDKAYSNKYIDQRKMDIFIPEENGNGKGLFFVHGGGWRKGSKKLWHSVAAYFCELGYTCASVGYRLVPDFVYPAQVEDVRMAFSFFKENANAFKFDPQSICAIGSSAGAHLILMLATIDSSDKLGRNSEMKIMDTRPAALVCYCPVCTVHMHSNLWDGRTVLPNENILPFMGKSEENIPDLYVEATPIDRIRGGEPPLLIIHGNADTAVPIAQAEAFHRKYQMKENKSQLQILDGIKHGFGYGIDTDEQKYSIKLILDFLNEQSNKNNN